MRTLERPARLPRAGLFAAVLIASIVAACASSPASQPLPTPTPSAYAFPTPWPPFTEPPTADQVYLALFAEALAIVPTNATTAGEGRDPIKRIDATYANWPLTISQYKSAKTLKAATKWKAGAKPKAGEPAVSFIGQNILVRWGATTGPAVTTLSDQQLKDANALRDALERLLGPLTARTVVPVPAPTPIPSVSAQPSSEASAKP